MSNQPRNVWLDTKQNTITDNIAYGIGSSFELGAKGLEPATGLKQTAKV